MPDFPSVLAAVAPRYLALQNSENHADTGVRYETLLGGRRFYTCTYVVAINVQKYLHYEQSIADRRR